MQMVANSINLGVPVPTCDQYKSAEKQLDRSLPYAFIVIIVTPFVHRITADEFFVVVRQD
jgi:hypothetical protein